MSRVITLQLDTRTFPELIFDCAVCTVCGSITILRKWLQDQFLQYG